VGLWGWKGHQRPLQKALADVCFNFFNILTRRTSKLCWDSSSTGDFTSYRENKLDGIFSLQKLKKKKKIGGSTKV
jgi:hypothetical protein